MPGRRQGEAIRYALRQLLVLASPDRFTPSGTSGKVACAECGARGYPPFPGDDWLPWQLPHLMPHLYVCECGRKFMGPQHWAQHVRDDVSPHRLQDHALRVPGAGCTCPYSPSGRRFYDGDCPLHDGPPA